MTDRAQCDTIRALVERIASRPLSTENTHATWCPPDWEEVVAWWDEAVTEARQLSGKTYGVTRGASG